MARNGMEGSGPTLIAGGWYDHLKYEINDLSLSHDLSPDVEATEDQEEHLLQVDMTQLISKTIKSIPLSQLHQNKTYSPRILSLRSVGGVSCTAADGGLYLETTNGRLLMTLDDYIDRIKLESPPFVIAMADEIPFSASKKRLTTAVRRSQTWLTRLQESSIDWSKSCLVGVVVGKSELPFAEGIEAQTNFLLSRGVGGILIGGIGFGESLEDRTTVVNCVQKAVGERVCPLFIQGIQTLPEIIHAISLGIDYISTDYPAILTRSGIVMTGDFSLIMHSLETKPTPEDASENPTKKQKLEPNNGTISHFDDLKTLNLDQSCNHLNLWDPRHARDTSPLVPGCDCHACRNYSRAYIHHLLICHELLAEVMIYSHNFHALRKLFRVCRKIKIVSAQSRAAE